MVSFCNIASSTHIHRGMPSFGSFGFCSAYHPALILCNKDTLIANTLQVF